MRLLIAGGTGLIGTRLLKLLDPSSFEVTILTRKKRENTKDSTFIRWSPEDESIDLDNLNDYDAIINLAGAGIADHRWTKQYKKQIIDSRVQSSRTIEKHLGKSDHRPKVYIGASAIGIYGDHGEKKLDEKSLTGSGFLASVTEQWEEAHASIKKLADRSVILRIGIVLSTKGGALKEIMKPARAGIYGYFGNGKSYYSWIHIVDMCRIIIEALKSPDMRGIYNATSTEPITNKELVRAAKKAKSAMGLLMSVPEFSLKLMLGEMSEMLLSSARVIPERLNQKQFKFRFSDPALAIKDLIEKKI